MTRSRARAEIEGKTRWRAKYRFARNYKRGRQVKLFVGFVGFRWELGFLGVLGIYLPIPTLLIGGI